MRPCTKPVAIAAAIVVVTVAIGAATALGAQAAVQENWFGTSFAAPLVAGVLAKRLQSRPGLTWAEAKYFLQSTATQGGLRGVPPGTPNLLLFDGR